MDLLDGQMDLLDLQYVRPDQHDEHQISHMPIYNVEMIKPQSQCQVVLPNRDVDYTTSPHPLTTTLFMIIHESACFSIHCQIIDF